MRPVLFLPLLLLVMLFILPLAGSPPVRNPNEVARLELSVAMAMWTTVDLEEPARIYGLSEDVALREGRLLADKAPGLSMAGVPLVWFAGIVLPTIPGTPLPEYWPLRHFSTAILVTLGSCLLSFLIAARIPGLGASGRISMALLAGLSTPIWTYGTVFFGHIPAAVLIAIAWILLLRPLTDIDLGTVRTAFLGGVSAGFAIATEYPTALLVAVVAVTLVVRRTSARQLGSAAAGLVIGLLPTLIYHQVAFGAPWLTGYAFKADPGFQQIHTTGLSGVSLPSLEGLFGILFSPSRGLFFYSPVLLMAPFGLWLMHRRRAWRDVAPLTVAAIVYVAFAAGFVDWQAGWCSASRHLIPVVPLLMIPTMVAMATMVQRTSTLVLLTTVVSLSAARVFLTVVITPFFPPEFSNPLSEFVLPSLRDGVVAPNIVTAASGLPSWIVWTAAAALTVTLMIWALARLSDQFPTWIAVVMTLVIAVQATWWVRQSSPADPRLENFRIHVLAGLGHTETATRIGGETLSPHDPP